MSFTFKDMLFVYGVDCFCPFPDPRLLNGMKLDSNRFYCQFPISSGFSDSIMMHAIKLLCLVILVSFQSKYVDT